MEALKPQLSVILPIRQWTEHSLTSIKSILQQSLTSFELLIIGQDDVQALKPLVPDDSRIQLLPRTAPGIVGALNTGISAARGRYIARMDDDDIAYSNRLQEQYDCLQSFSDRHLCATRIRFVDVTGAAENIASGNKSYEHWLNSLITPEQLKLACYRECPLPHPTWMAHCRVWQELEGYQQLDAPEDYDLILRAMLAGIEFCKPEPVLQDWREHPHRLTYRDSRYRRAAFAERAAWAAVQHNSGLALHQGRRIWLCGTGRHARNWHDALVSYGAHVSGFVDISRPGQQRSKRQLPVIDYQQLAKIRHNELIISTLTQAQSRRNTRHFMQAQGWQEGDDYLMGG